MTMRLAGKAAIITGGGAGIGEATATLFAEEGAQVVVADTNTEAGEAVVAAIKAQGGEAVFAPTDIALEDDVRRMCGSCVKAFGKIDVLVNNAAVFVLKGLEASAEDWHRSLDVNVIGTAMCSRYAAEEMEKQGSGAIVNIASISSFVAQPNFLTYSATKAALLQMTRNMALDLAHCNIRVNCVCPGTILTRASQDHMERTGTTLEEFKAEENPKHLLNRIGEPREVAYPILFLASEEASFITGTHLMVDGGYTVR